MPGYGAIYIAHNPRDGPNVFKVGRTERSVPERMAELTADTSNLGSYEAKATFVVADVEAAEAACHRRLNLYRIQDNREFFDLEFSRLFEIVQEETLPFASRDSREEGPAQGGRNFSTKNSTRSSTQEKIEAARRQIDRVQHEFDKSKEEAKRAISEYFELFRSRTLQMMHELEDVDWIQWHVPEDLLVANIPPQWEFCSARVFSKFRSQPPVLRLSGNRGGQFVEERDDGRLGRLEVWGEITMMGNACSPILTVRAVSLVYDDYRTHFRSHVVGEREFTNAEEALDTFDALVVENAARPRTSSPPL